MTTMAATAADRGTLSAPQYIVRAAVSLDEPFHESALIVRAWQDCPPLFGLRGREGQYPDANRVRCVLQGKRGLVARRWLRKVAPLTYELTRVGRRKAGQLADANGTAVREVLKAVAVPRPLDDWLGRQFESRAYHLFVCRGEARISLADALAWWGLTRKAGGDAVTAEVAAVRDRLADLADYAGVALRFAKPGETRRAADGMVVDADLLKRMRDLNTYLALAFGRRLGIA